MGIIAKLQFATVPMTNSMYKLEQSDFFSQWTGGKTKILQRFFFNIFEISAKVKKPIKYYSTLRIVLHRYLSRSWYDEVIYNFHYFTAVPLGKFCSMLLIRFNNRIFIYCFISLLTLSKFSQCIKVLMFNSTPLFN